MPQCHAAVSCRSVTPGVAPERQEQEGQVGRASSVRAARRIGARSGDALFYTAELQVDVELCL
jgi:hypothetical protein